MLSPDGNENAQIVQMGNASRHERLEAEYSLDSLGNTGAMALPRRKLYRWLKCLAVIFLLAVVLIFVRLFYVSQTSMFGFSIFADFTSLAYRIGNHEIEYRASKRLLIFSDTLSEKSLSINSVGENLTAGDIKMKTCEEMIHKPMNKSMEDRVSVGRNTNHKSLCLKWKNDVQLVVNESETASSACYTVMWSAPKVHEKLENCIRLQGTHWYGGSSLYEQQWPLEDVSVPMQPFIPSRLDTSAQSDGTEKYGPVLERFWFNSEGFAVVVDKAVPLHVSVSAAGDQQLCLRAQYDGSVYKAEDNKPLVLKYTVCKGRTAKHVHQSIMTKFLQLPKIQPDESLLRDPVWSTRGVNLQNLTQSQVLSLQQDITTYKLPCSRLLIVGNYTRRVGSLFFDFDRFPNAHQMVSEMRTAGFNVSTSVLPCIQIEDTNLAYKEGEKMGVFILTTDNKVLEGHLGNKTCALIDFTNSAAKRWMESRLHHFKLEAFVQSFYFDSADIGSLLSNPSDYISHYMDIVHLLGDRNAMVNVGHGTQHLGLMVDVGARLSSWDHKHGLKSIIPTVLTLGLLGYAFLLIGPVGGTTTVYNHTSNAVVLPDRELYIRWMQLASFLPGLEISVGPWQYDKQVTDMTLGLLSHRRDHIVNVLQGAAKEHISTGAPLVRPLWWIAEEDETAQRIDCEFLVGDKILVAPVLEKGARSRDVYLPNVGTTQWYDELHGKVFKGGQWLRDYPVSLYQVATFVTF